MTDVWRLRLGRMKGPLHARLHALLRAAWKDQVCTQDSLSRAMGKTQTSVGQYLLDQKGGALDLDEASAALDHIGSSLGEFVAGQVPRTLDDSERLARALGTRPELEQLIKDLLGVPRTRLSAVIDLARTGIEAATGQRGGRTVARRPGQVRVTRTTRGSTRHR